MKRFLPAVLFVLVLLLGLNFNTVSAQSPSITPTPNHESRMNEDVPRNFSTYTQTMVIELMVTVVCQLAGVDPINPDGRCLGIDPLTRKIGYVESNGGLVHFMGSAIVATYNLPITSGQYFNHLAGNFGIAKTTQAQEIEGAGFSSLYPLFNIWKTFRNLAYLFFVIIFILIGLGIVFRFNIDARSVMTIQSAIPRVIVTLLLITFSFAIAGLLIDMMYISLFFLYGVFTEIPGVSFPSLNPSRLQGVTPFAATGAFGGVTGISVDVGGALRSIMASILEGTPVGTVLNVLLSPLMLANIVTLPLSLFGIGPGFVSANDVIGLFTQLLAIIVVLIAMMYALFRLWFALLKAYVFILIDVSLAPVWIAAGLVPGSSLGFGHWFKHILSYILVFPVTYLMFAFAGVFAQAFASAGEGLYFVPPFVGNGFNPKHLGALISMAIILMTPEVINIVKDTLKAPSLNTYQKSITQAIGVGQKVGITPMRRVKDKMFESDDQGPKGPGAILYEEKLRPRIKEIQSKLPMPGRAGKIIAANNRKRLVENFQVGRMTKGKLLDEIKLYNKQLGLKEDDIDAYTREQYQEMRNKKPGEDSSPPEGHTVTPKTGPSGGSDGSSSSGTSTPPHADSNISGDSPESASDSAATSSSTPPAPPPTTVHVNRNNQNDILLQVQGIEYGNNKLKQPAESEISAEITRQGLEDNLENREKIKNEFLIKHAENIEKIVSTVNKQETINEGDEIYEQLTQGLANTLEEDQLFEGIVRRLALADGKDVNTLDKNALLDEYRQKAHDAFAQEMPILKTRYDLREGIKTVNAMKSGSDSGTTT